MEKIFCEPIMKNLLVITILLFVSANCRPTGPAISVNSDKPVNKDCLKDILVLLDTSRSITETNFKYVQEFLINLIKQLNVGPDGVHLSFVTFASKKKTRVLLPFGKKQNQRDLIKWLREQNYQDLEGDTTRTDLAFKLANKIFRKRSPLNHRPNVDDVVLLFTDGQPTLKKHLRLKQLVADSSTELKKKDVTIIGVAAGQVEETFARLIEKWSTKYFKSDWGKQSLKNLSTTIISPLCKCAPVTPPSTTTLPSTPTLPSTTTLAPSTTTPSDCSKDILVLLDNSISIGVKNFESIRKFLINLIKKLTVGPDGVHLGFITFSSKEKTRTLLRVGEKQNQTELINWLEEQNYKDLMGHTTRTDLAFKLANDMFRERSPLNHRPNVDDVILLFTDGHPTMEKAVELKDIGPLLDLVDGNSTKLKKKHVQIIGVAAGQVKATFTHFIEKWSTKYFKTNWSNKSLGNLANTIVDPLCKNITDIPPCTTLPSTRITSDCSKDILVLLDNSISIGKRNFKSIRKFLINLVKQLTVGPDGVNLGFITFSNKKNTRALLPFGEKQNQTELIKWLKEQNYKDLKGHTTRTDLAFQLANKMFSQKSPLNHRHKADDVILLFTDGHPTMEKAVELKDIGPLLDLVDGNSTELKKKHVQIIGVAAGRLRATFTHFIEKWSTKYFKTDWSKKSLENLANTIVNPLCGKPIENPCTTPMTIPPRTTTTPPVTTIPPGCSGSKGKDILFVVDGTVDYQQSNALAQKDFNKIEQFILSIITELNNDQFRVGVMQYTGKDKAKMETDFQSSRITKKITMKQQKGNTRYTGNALIEAINQFYVHNYLESRENNPDVIVLITRGTPNDRDVALSEAKGLPLHTKLITVGVYSVASAPYLAAFLNAMNNCTSFLSKYKDLEKSRRVVLDEICSDRICRGDLGPKPPTCEKPFDRQDIFFLVDGTASITSSNFDKIKNFLSRLIPRLSVDSSDINTGLMQFSKADLTKVEWKLGKYSEIETESRAQKLTYQSGTKTEAGDALTRVNNEVFTGTNGDRPDVNDTLFLFTDGDAHDLSTALAQIKILKKKGVRIITIAAGKDESLKLFKPVLVEMASSPELAIAVNYDKLKFFKFVEKIIEVVCPPKKPK